MIKKFIRTINYLVILLYLVSISCDRNVPNEPTELFGIGPDGGLKIEFKKNSVNLILDKLCLSVQDFDFIMSKIADFEFHLADTSRLNKTSNSCAKFDIVKSSPSDRQDSCVTYIIRLAKGEEYWGKLNSQLMKIVLLNKKDFYILYNPPYDHEVKLDSLSYYYGYIFLTRHQLDHLDSFKNISELSEFDISNIRKSWRFDKDQFIIQFHNKVWPFNSVYGTYESINTLAIVLAEMNVNPLIPPSEYSELMKCIFL